MLTGFVKRLKAKRNNTLNLAQKGPNCSKASISQKVKMTQMSQFKAIKPKYLKGKIAQEAQKAQMSPKAK
jgi:hypothetical protein